MRKKILSVLKYLFFLALGAFLFWLAIKDADFNKIIIEFKNANYNWVVLAIIIMIVSHMIRALRWNQLLGTLNIKTKISTTFYAVMIGYFVNLAVPRLGEISRCGILSNYHKVPVNTVIGTVIAERVFDIFCMVIILLITILAQLDFLSNFLDQNIIKPLAERFTNGTNAILIIGGISLGLIIICVSLYRAFLPRLRKLKIFQKIKEIINGFWIGIKTIKNIKYKKKFFLYTFLMWSLYILTVYISFFAVKDTRHLGLLDALTVMIIGSIGVLAPTQGGIGAYQYVVKVALVGLFLIPPDTALFFANILYFTQWFMIIILGGLSWGIMIVLQKRIKKDEHTGTYSEQNISFQ